MKKLYFRNNQKVRHFDVVLHVSLRDLHHEMLMEFIMRGVKDPNVPASPSGSSSGPYFKKGLAVKDYSHYNFMLDDSYKFESGETMADEYVRRMEEAYEKRL